MRPRGGAEIETWDRAASAGAASSTGSPDDEDDPAAWYNLGYALHAQGDLAGAEHAYSRALRLDGGSPQTWFNLGNVLSDAGRNGEAVGAYREAVALDADDHEAWNNLGAGLCETTCFREAVDCFEAALAIEPTYHPSWNNLGSAVEALDGDLPRAVDAYRQATALCQNRANYQLNLASALCRLDRVGEAARHLDDALKMDPGLRTVVPAFPEFEPLLDGSS